MFYSKAVQVCSLNPDEGVSISEQFERGVLDRSNWIRIQSIIVLNIALCICMIEIFGQIFYKVTAQGRQAPKFDDKRILQNSKLRPR